MLKYITKFALMLAVIPMLFIPTGCPSQNQDAALAQILGSTAASIASIEGNTALATKLTTDTAAVVTAIQNFKPGSNAQNVVAVINIVVDDLNLIPNVGPYAPLITLALGTAESLITLFAPSAPAGTAVAHTNVHVANAPTTAAQFKAAVVSFNKSHPSLKPVQVK
jgi:hypothetical protein